MDLLLSHDELRAVLLLAGKRIRDLSPRREDDPILVLLRKKLREARVVARAFRELGLTAYQGPSRASSPPRPR
jgi:hypothetical protein